MKHLPAAALLVLAAAWLWLQAPQLALLPGDEPLYLLDAQRILHGDQLYRDVFLAHPPARVWQAALVLALGAPLAWAKLWAPAATLGVAALLWRQLHRAGQPLASGIAPLLFLASNVVLSHGAQFVGVEQALLLATLATTLALAQRWLLAGLALGLATQWALHGALLAVPLLVWAWQDRALPRFAAGLAVGLLPLVAELAYFGQPMLDQAFAYHIRKVTEMAPQKGPARVLPFLLAQAPFLLLAALAAWRGAPLARRLGRSGLAALALLLLWPRLQPYYFLLPLPWLAGAAALTIASLYAAKPARHVQLLLGVLVLGIAWAPLTTALARRTLSLAVAPEMTQLAAQVQTLAHGQPLWGDGALVPLLALRTGLPVALGDTDTNAQRFASGLTPPVAHVAAVLAQKPLIVLVPHHGIDTVPAIHDALIARCDVVGHFNAPAANFAGLLLQPR